MPVAGTPLRLLLLRLREWLPIPEFEAAMNAYFSGERSAAQIADYRAKRGDQKKLRDEVAPVLRHLRFTRAQGEVRFHLNDDSPDCWVRDDASAAAQGIEVTVALAREQQALGVELNEMGISPGFLRLQDDVPTAAYVAKRARGRVMFVADAKLQATGEGIKRCIKRKSNPKYAGFDLLIEAPLDGLSDDRWSVLVPDLQAAASGTLFRQIHVIGGGVQNRSDSVLNEAAVMAGNLTLTPILAVGRCAAKRAPGRPNKDRPERAAAIALAVTG